MTVYVDPYQGYTVGLAPTGQRGPYGKWQVAYYLDSPSGERLFEGDDLYPSPLYAADGPEVAAELLVFLTLTPDDTDTEYFDSYTDRQLEWCQSADAEELRVWAAEVEQDGKPWYPQGW